MRVLVDFDGVCSQYKKWQGHNHVDPPMPGAMDAIRAYMWAGIEVTIFTTRADTEEGRKVVRAALLDYGLSEFEVGSIVITAVKLPAVMIIDDRGFQFKGTFPTPEEVKSFKPWKP